MAQPLGTKQRKRTPVYGGAAAQFFPILILLGREDTPPSDVGAPRGSLTHAPMRSTMHVDILVPVADNDGRPFPPFAFETFEHFLTTLCGGFTRRGDVEGAWRSPETGDVMRDRSRSYVVTLAAEEADGQVARIESFIRRYFRQEAAFLELIPTRATAF
ncbi:MAG TPA: hypothetical protein VNI54_04890 [Thermoanaerobaculia bacterium]|nr:hypothetical protein [Thermoanaerobaculia bacterium]